MNRPPYSLAGDCGGLQNRTTRSIPQIRIKNNPPDRIINNPITFYERYALCRLMVYGEPLKFKYPFTDPRHELIYEYLSYLQRQEYQPGIDSLIRYLNECHVINKAGGDNYVRYIFRGIKGGRHE